MVGGQLLPRNSWVDRQIIFCDSVPHTLVAGYLFPCRILFPLFIRLSVLLPPHKWLFPSQTLHSTGVPRRPAVSKLSCTIASYMVKFQGRSMAASIVLCQMLNTLQSFQVRLRDYSANTQMMFSSTETDKLMVIHSSGTLILVFRIRNGHVDFKQKFVRYFRHCVIFLCNQSNFLELRNLLPNAPRGGPFSVNIATDIQMRIL